MKTAGIGDMILLTAIARDAATALPGAEVVVLCSAENADLARMVPGVRVVELPVTEPWRAVPALRRERLDVLVDFGQWSRVEALYAALSGARFTAGFETPGQRRAFAYDAVVAHRNDVPEMDNLRRLCRVVGLESDSPPRLEPSSEPGRRLPAGPFAIFHLWPGGFRRELREWPTERWLALADHMAETGWRVLVTGGPADADRSEAFAASCTERGLDVESIAGRYGLGELTTVLAAARCVVSVNTGVMHLAAAVGAPTIALNGPTSSLRWGPIGPRAVSVDSPLPGCGYLNLGFEYAGRPTDCMRAISVDRVASEVAALAHP